MKLSAIWLRPASLALFTTLVLAASPSTGEADEPITVAPIFGDHMVLQRDQPLPVWGTAAAGTKVTVDLGDQTGTSTTNDKGRWRVVFDAMPASAEPATLRIAESGSADDEILIEDVLVGDVWLCSGQSNMAFTLSKCENGAEEVAAATHPNLRLNGANNGWTACGPESVGRFSGVAYYFGRRLHDELEVPIGLIGRAVGGTPVEWWTPRESLPVVPFARQMLNVPSEAWRDYEKALAAWRRKAKADGRKNAGPQPKAPGTTEEGVLAGIYGPNKAGSLYARFLDPIAGFAIRGAIWYQGERNTKAGLEAAKAYRPLLANMITSWRMTWGQGDFAFLVVQLPTFAGGSEGWAVVQEAQAAAVEDVPNAGYVDIRDQPDGGLHPKNKKPVGERLADLALEKFIE